MKKKKSTNPILQFCSQTDLEIKKARIDQHFSILIRIF